MQYVLERFEEEVAVIEQSDGDAISFLSVPRCQLPPEAKEGDLLCLERENWKVDSAATQQKRGEMAHRLKKLGLI